MSLGTSQAVDLALAPALAVELALAPALAGGHAGHAQAPRGAAPTITAVIAAQVGGREVRRRCRGPKEARGKNSAAEGARAAIAGWRGERAGRGVVAPSDGLLPSAATVGRRPGGQKPGDDGALDGGQCINSVKNPNLLRGAYWARIIRPGGPPCVPQRPTVLVPRLSSRSQLLSMP